MITKQASNARKSDGFTLLELLVVIAIVGAVAAIAAPSWSGFLTQKRMNSASSDLLGILRNAQEEAQSRQQSREVLFSSTDLSVTVRNQSASTGGITTTLGNGELNDNFSLVASTASVTFDHDGQVDATTLPYVVKVTNNVTASQSCVIVTTLLGSLKSSSGEECDTFSNSPL